MSDPNKSIAELTPEEKRAYLARLLRQKAQAAQNGGQHSPAPPERSPLSHGQRALWFLYRLAPNSPAYNLLYVARVRSTLNIPALQRSVQALFRRHPILTATFSMQSGELLQRFHANQKLHFETIDASTWDWPSLQQRIQEEGDRPFDLEDGPLLRIKLFKLAPQDHIIALTVHHIGADSWSLDLVINEIGTLYATEAGLPLAGLVQLPPQPPQYTSYIRWQAEMLAGPEGERLWSYWQQELAGDLPMLNLPLDHPRPPVQTYRGASHIFKLSADLSQRLKALASAERSTLFMLLLAAFKVLLFRYTDQEDLLIGTPALGRSRSDLEKIVGYLANPVVLRTNFAGNPTFSELLAQVRQKVIAALDHQDFPFPLLVERLQPRRDPSYSPIFQAMFILDKPSQASVASLLLEPLISAQQGSAFDLTLRMIETEGTLSADMRYNPDLFDASTMARMEQHFQTLLAGIVAQPDQRVRDLPLLTETEEHQILVEWNDTQADYPEHECIHQLIEAQVARSPHAPALVFEDTQLTYDELNRRANRLAHALQAAGVGSDSLVGVCMERSVEMVISLLGILKAGAAYVPLDPTYPRDRLDYMIQDAHMPLLLTQARLRDRLPLEGMRIISLDTEWGTFASNDEHNPRSSVQPENLAYMIYTSGSTGRPKGVMSVHRGLTNRLHWMQRAYQLTPADRVMQKTPFSFDVSVWEFFWPLLTGACLVVARPGGHQDPAYLASLIAEQHITTLHFVPSMLQVFLLEPDLARCSSLKRVICSGEALPAELQERFFSRFPSGVELHNLYGPTEASIDVTFWQCQPGAHDTVVPIGHPIDNTQIYILDRQQQPVPVGVPGELYIGGVGLARGYYNRPELTAEKFVPNPFRPGERLFRTADLARYRSDGAIEFLGRIDYQVKINGFRIELEEIEVVLSQHPALKEVVVMAREDVPGNKRLVAYLVPDSAALQSPDLQFFSAALESGETHILVDAFRNFLKEKLPHYMIPAAFVFLEAIPLTPNGKANRQALPAPDLTRPNLEAAFVAPRNPVEEQLANIWAQVLGLDKVGIHDNFFDLGGASIQSLQIIAKANEAGLQLTPELIFEHQTIAELAPFATLTGATTSSRDDIALPASAASPTMQSAPAGLGNTIIESLGVYLPPQAVTSREILQHCLKPIDFPLEQLTGIYSRRMAGDTEFAIDLAKKAVASCLANSKYHPLDIDLLICSNISRCDGPNTRVSFEPSTSMRLKRHFGFDNAFVFDVSNACTGMFTAIYIVDAFLKAGLIRRGMVVSGEYITHLIQTAQKEMDSYMDSRLACLTVGDAGAALILEQSPNQNAGFHELDLYTLGRYYDLCIAKATDREHGGAIMYTDAVRVAAVNIKQAISHAIFTLERSGWSPHDFQHVIMHQTSRMSLNDAAREINSVYGREVLNQDNVIHNLAERGNTASTTHFVALMDHILSDNIHSGDNIVFGITGSGATIGTALYTLDDLPDRLRRYTLGESRPVKLSTHAEPVQAIVQPASKPRIRVESIGTLPRGRKLQSASLELARSAAENCLARSSHNRSDIDLLIYSGVYRDEFLCEPAIASMVAGELKINDHIESQQEKKTFALDLFNGAIATLNACQLAAAAIASQRAKSVMIVAAEIENNAQVQPQAELLGLEETASVMILDASPDGGTGFDSFVFKYFPAYSETFAAYTVLRNGKTCMRFEQDPNLTTYYLQCIHETVQEFLRSQHLDLSDIKCILPPQISPAFTSALAQKLEIGQDKFVDIAQEGHDLYTSSLPYALQHVREQNLVQPGDIGLIISIGSGIQVGCASYYF